MSYSKENYSKKILKKNYSKKCLNEKNKTTKCPNQTQNVLLKKKRNNVRLNLIFKSLKYS